MTNNPFFTLSSSSGEVQPELSSLSPNSPDSSFLLESSSASSVSVVSATTHDTRRTKYHIDELSTFAKRLEDAAASVFPNKDRSRYKDVQVLLLRWEQDDMGVEWELDDLAKTLKSAYAFNTETWLIPTAQPHLALMGKAFKMVQDFGKKDNLLIIYYAGHGGMNTSRQPLWTWSAPPSLQGMEINFANSSSHPNSPSLQWYAVQTIFEHAESDTLLLLDCCAAASGAPADGQSSSVTETIAACGFETWAPQPGRHSFTNTLIAVLEEWSDSPGFTAAMLHCEVLNRLRHEKPERKGKMKKFECRRTPVHILSTADTRAGSVELRRRRSDHNNAETENQGLATSTNERREDMEANSNKNETTSADTSKNDNQGLYDPDSLTKVFENSCTALPQVLISLALEEDQLLDFHQCLRWLHQFPALAKYAKVQGVYRSNSTLLILALPVLIWDCIPDDPACSFIGYIHSSNLLVLERDEGGYSVHSKTKYEEDLHSHWGMEDDLTAKTDLASKHSFGEMPFHSHRYSAREPHLTTLSSVDRMSRGNSSSSLSSNASSRSKQRLQTQNNIAAARPLMPKCGSEDTPMSRDISSQSMNRLDNRPLDTLDISLKTTYQRPKHDRVKCKLCDGFPEGFRGEHELQRHVDRVHKSLVKMWICEEPKDNLQHPKPVLPLSRCKACHQQKKEYMAYYNAAIHLRRAHFKPKMPIRTKSNAKVEGGEKRGGVGVGDWPPMSELKYWLKEVEVEVTRYRLTEDEQARLDAADASDDENFAIAFDNALFSSGDAADGMYSGLRGNSFDTKLADTKLADIKIAGTNLADINLADINFADTNLADYLTDTPHRYEDHGIQ